MNFRNFVIIFPLEKGRWLLFEQSLISSTQGCFVLTLVEISPLVLKKKMKMWKVYKETDE